MSFGRNPSPLLIYILHSGNLYGTERMALATLEGMVEYGTRVVAAPAPSGTGSVAVEARAAGYQTLAFQTSWQLLVGLVPWFLKYRCIDVIGVGVGSSRICHALARILRVRLRQLQVAHGGTGDAWAYGRKHQLNHIPIGMIAVSSFVRDKLLAYGVRPESITVIDNFLSESQRRGCGRRARYAPGSAGARVLDQQRVKVMIVSRVDSIKKIDVLVQAVERDGLAEFDFDIFGTGEELQALRNRTAHMSNIHFHGYVSDVSARLANADLLLHLCPEEPFGLVILEAFLTGVVVVVPDAGGAGSLVQDGLTGLRFAADRPDDVSRVLHLARTMPGDLLQAMADAAAQSLNGRFSQSEGIRRYRQALAAAPHRKNAEGAPEPSA